MLVHGTPARMPLPPRIDTRPVEPTKTLQPGHSNSGLKLLQADGALSRVDAVLLGRRVGEHAGPARRYGRQYVRAA